MPTTRARNRSTRPAALLAAAATAALVQPASATWSILIADTRTGEIAVASATCVPNIDLRAETPVLILGVGAATAQSVVDTSGVNRARIFAEFARGTEPQSILDLLAATDGGHDNRQYGMLDATGNTVTYSGPNNAQWAGGVTGRIEAGEPGDADDIVYAVQGNILTGEPVVLAAEDAILNTEGDLAEKLMAAMEAAYAFGGDGRCSCPRPDPTGCGAPPKNGFVTTADVGYMLVGRLGDRQAGGSFLPLNTLTGPVVAGDADRDGRADLVTMPSFGGPVELQRNITARQGDVLAFAASSITTNLTQITSAAMADVNNDSDPDLVLSNASKGYLMIGNGDGTFGPVIETSIGTGVRAGVVGHFDSTNGPRPEYVAIATGGNRLRTYTIGPDSGMSDPNTQPLPATPNAITRTDDGVAVGLASGAVLPLASNGDGTFTEGAPVPVSAAPITLDAGDLNGDGLTDYIAGRNDRTVSVLVSTEGGTHAETEIGLDGQIRDAGAADLDGDGDLDFGVLLTFGRFIAHLNDGTGVFAAQPIVRTVEGTTLEIADLTGDGLPDAVVVAGRVLGVYTNEGAGPVADDRGFAGGDYFLELNVRNGPDAPFEDPVPQLRSEFDAWRASRAGLPDGSRSFIAQSPERVNALGSETGPYNIVVHLLDDQGVPVGPLDPERFDLIAPNGRPVPLEIVGAVPTAADGVWVLSAVPTGETGRTELWVRYTTDQGPVVVQPAPDLIAGLTVADLADPIGVLDLGDIVAFVTAFLAGDAGVADLTGDGVIDMADIDLFLTEFDAG